MLFRSTTDGDLNVVKEVVVPKVVEVSVPTIQLTELFTTVNLMRMNEVLDQEDRERDRQGIQGILDDAETERQWVEAMKAKKGKGKGKLRGTADKECINNFSFP